jgi:hypothetical protein
VTAVQIVHPDAELWNPDDPAVQTMSPAELNRSWLVLSLTTGRFEYTPIDPSDLSGRRAAVMIPLVTAAFAATLLERLAGPAQRLLDAYTGDVPGLDPTREQMAFQTAAGVDVPDSARVYAMRAGTWIAERYGTRITYARESGVTADTSDARLRLLAGREQKLASSSGPYAQTILIGVFAELDQVRQEQRDRLMAAAAGRAEQMRALQLRQEEDMRRMLAWGLPLRVIADVTGVTHPTVKSRRLEPERMLEHLRARVEAGTWLRNEKVGEWHMPFGGALLVVPAGGGEVRIVTTDPYTSKPTGVWTGPPRRHEAGAADPAAGVEAGTG